MVDPTHPWQSPLFMKRVLGVDGALPGAVGQKRAACNLIPKEANVIAVANRVYAATRLGRNYTGHKHTHTQAGTPAPSKGAIIPIAFVIMQFAAKIHRPSAVRLELS